MLQKSWEQLRQKLFVMESSVQVHERCKVLDLFKEIPGCKETGEVGVDEWLSADCECDQKVSDQEIVFLLTQHSVEESDKIDEVE